LSCELSPGSAGSLFVDIQIKGAADAQSHLRGDLVRSVGIRQCCKRSRNNSWCSGGRPGGWSGSRPGRGRRRRRCGGGYRYGQWSSGHSTGACSRDASACSFGDSKYSGEEIRVSASNAGALRSPQLRPGLLLPSVMQHSGSGNGWCGCNSVKISLKLGLQPIKSPAHNSRA